MNNPIAEALRGLRKAKKQFRRAKTYENAVALQRASQAFSVAKKENIKCL